MERRIGSEEEVEDFGGRTVLTRVSHFSLHPRGEKEWVFCSLGIPN